MITNRIEVGGRKDEIEEKEAEGEGRVIRRRKWEEYEEEED